MKDRILLFAGVLVLVAAEGSHFHNPWIHAVGVVADWIVSLAALFTLAVVIAFYVHTRLNARAGEQDEARVRRVTGMQLLNLDEVEYDGPATRHYPEGGDR